MVIDWIPSCAWISIGTYYATNLTVQWRVPLAMACVGPLALLIGLPFIPGKSEAASAPECAH